MRSLARALQRITKGGDDLRALDASYEQLKGVMQGIVEKLFDRATERREQNIWYVTSELTEPQARIIARVLRQSGLAVNYERTWDKDTKGYKTSFRIYWDEHEDKFR